jgi:hypothetical protein
VVRIIRSFATRHPFAVSRSDRFALHHVFHDLCRRLSLGQPPASKHYNRCITFIACTVPRRQGPAGRSSFRKAWGHGRLGVKSSGRLGGRLGVKSLWGRLGEGLEAWGQIFIIDRRYKNNL